MYLFYYLCIDAGTTDTTGTEADEFDRESKK